MELTPEDHVETKVKTSVVDPNTMSLNQDPGFWTHFGPDPDPGLCYQFYRKIYEVIFGKGLTSFQT